MILSPVPKQRTKKKLGKMKIMVIPIIIGALEMIFKELVKRLGELEIGGQTQTIQTAALLISARIIR